MRLLNSVSFSSEWQRFTFIAHLQDQQLGTGVLAVQGQYDKWFLEAGYGIRSPLRTYVLFPVLPW